MNDQTGSDREQIRRRLSRLRTEYVDGLPARFDRIDACWHSLQKIWSREELQDLHRDVYRLAGSGASFGFHELSARANALERVLLVWLGQSSAPPASELDRLGGSLEVLRSASRAVAEPEEISLLVTADGPSVQAGESRLIYLVEDDARLAKRMVSQLRRFGYEVRPLTQDFTIIEAIEQQRPDVLIMDMMWPDGSLEEANALKSLRDDGKIDFPLVFMSVRSDLEARLAAVRAGAEVYLVKPVELHLLVDELDQLTHRRDEPGFRVLLVDEDTQLTEHYALVLEGGGMDIAKVHHPGEVLDALSNFNPDLILMDVYLPGCSGVELAKVIRQQDRFLGIPIVYLSTENSLEPQLLALRMGGDDFLTLPIDDEHLLSSVSIRAARARELNELMVQDSLTGLLKHTKIKEQLEAEIARSRRTRGRLSLVMVDIDRFKSINDDYGHLAGDRVIKSLAQLLKRRVRQTDTVGRYGGEEFAVIMPDCEAADAVAMIDRIRADFARVKYRHGDAGFKVTFSAGVADQRKHHSAESLIAAADAALYKAKRKGRNRVAK